ncbi:hypothetical protein VU01_11821, partial [Candidatus Electrothrix marina]
MEGLAKVGTFCPNLVCPDYEQVRESGGNIIKFGHQDIFNLFSMFRCGPQPIGNRILLMALYTTDTADTRTFGDHRQTFEDLFFSCTAAVKNRASCLCKSSFAS